MTEKTKIGDVPCNGCKACCRNEIVVLRPENGDIPDNYQTTPVEINGEQQLALQVQPNGDCIYLGEDGCEIHERAPAACKAFDCRLMWYHLERRTTRAQRQAILKKEFGQKDVWKSGRLKLPTLDATFSDLMLAQVFWADTPRKISMPSTEK